MTTIFGTCDIVADEKIKEVGLLVEGYPCSDDRTTTVPSDQSCVLADNENHEQVCAILSAQYRGGIRSDLA